MNRALLDELQRRRAYPSVTLLLNTTPAPQLAATELATIQRLLADVDRRLTGDVGDDIRRRVLDRLGQLVDEQRFEPTAHALALCASTELEAAVKLGRAVEERAVIDDTFATRDLVADLNRTALFRVVTISDRAVRTLVGDRRRLVEERSAAWPLVRDEEQSLTSWRQAVVQRLRQEHQRHPLPTIVAGVERSVHHTASAVDPFETIGFLAGNHDRTSWTELHNAAWPIVVDWLRADRTRAMQRLEQARSARRYAGGIHEVWPLANEGRVELVVVEEGFALPVRIDGNDQLHPASDLEAPDVVDDIVDDTIEAVLRTGGSAVIMADDDLHEHDRIAAILRY